MRKGKIALALCTLTLLCVGCGKGTNKTEQGTLSNVTITEAPTATESYTPPEPNTVTTEEHTTESTSEPESTTESTEVVTEEPLDTSTLYDYDLEGYTFKMYNEGWVFQDGEFVYDDESFAIELKDAKIEDVKASIEKQFEDNPVEVNWEVFKANELDYQQFSVKMFPNDKDNIIHLVNYFVLARDDKTLVITGVFRYTDEWKCLLTTLQEKVE